MALNIATTSHGALETFIARQKIELSPEQKKALSMRRVLKIRSNNGATMLPAQNELLIKRTLLIETRSLHQQVG